jgi:hypothetical protein
MNQKPVRQAQTAWVSRLWASYRLLPEPRRELFAGIARALRDMEGRERREGPSAKK